MKFIISFFVRIYFYATFFLIVVNFAVILTLGKVVLYNDLLLKSVIQGFIIGGLMVAVQILRLKKAGVKQFSRTTFSLRQKMILITDLSISEVKEKLVKETRSGKILTSSNKDGITLEYLSGIWSWGVESIIKIKPGENGSNLVEISSRPSLITTLFDFGQGLVNILYIKKLLNVLEQE